MPGGDTSVSSNDFRFSTAVDPCGRKALPAAQACQKNYCRFPVDSPAPDPDVPREFIPDPEEVPEVPCRELPAVPCPELPVAPCPELFKRTFAPVLPEERSLVVDERVVVEPWMRTLAPERSRTLVRLDTPTPTLTPGRRRWITVLSPSSTKRRNFFRLITTLDGS